jgi:hypothetical protein
MLVGSKQVIAPLAAHNVFFNLFRQRASTEIVGQNVRFDHTILATGNNRLKH